ncbi:MAG: hypothetical protein R3F30_04390 [Planctomycetota bacterium]
MGGLPIPAAPAVQAGGLELGAELGFAAPWLLALLLLVPILVWLHREPARELATDRLEIWRRALARLGLRRRRRLPPSLLLAILALVALVRALAGAGRPERAGPRRFAAVLDVSPSMAARDGGRTRTTAAVAASRPSWRGSAEVEGVLYGLGRERVTELARFAAARALPAGLRADLLAEDAAVLLARAERARPGLARALADQAGPDCAVLLSATASEPAAGAARDDDNLYLRGFGSPDARSPAAILDASFVDPWPAAELELSVEAARPLAAGARLVLRSPVQGRSEGFAFGRGSGDEPDGPMLLDVPRAFGPEVEARLEPGDGFVLDELLLLEARPAWAPTLRALPYDDPDLRVLTEFLVGELGARELRDGTGDEAGGLELREGGRLEAWPDDGRVRLCFGTLLPGAAAEGRPEGPLEWARAAPLLLDLDLSTLGVEEAVLAPPLDDDAEVLVSLGDAPFVVLWPEHRLLWCGSELGRNRLASQAFLPLLVVRALTRLAPVGAPGRLLALADPEESRIAARTPPRSRPTPAFWRPRRPYWPELVAAFALCVLLRAALVRR